MSVASSRAVLLALILGGCGEAPLLALHVVTPVGADPLAPADRLRLVISEPRAESIVALTDAARFSLELEVEVEGAVGTISLEGFAGETLVARGETPPLALRPEAGELALLVGRAGALNRIEPRMGASRRGLTAILMPAIGVLFAGGTGDDDAPAASAWLYDFFVHRLDAVAPLPEVRHGAVGVPCGSSCALVALGATAAAGLAAELLRFDGAAWTRLPDLLPPDERRREGSVVALPDGRYLVVGGEGAQGPLASVLMLDPGATTGIPALKVLSSRALAPRRRPVLAPGTGTVLVACGQPPGSPVAEVLFTASSSFSPLALEGPPLASGCDAVELGDGRVALVGGRAVDGTLIRDGWIIEPATLSATRVPDLLKRGRADHRVLRLGQTLVVVGGVAGTGEPADTVEVLSASDLTWQGDALQSSPRVDFSVGRLGPGSFLLAGGEVGGGADGLDIYQTATPVP